MDNKEAPAVSPCTLSNTVGIRESPSRREPPQRKHKHQLACPAMVSLGMLTRMLGTSLHRKMFMTQNTSPMGNQFLTALVTHGG